MRTGRSDKCKINNLGITIVELVVVISIMAVMTAGSLSLMVAINNAKTRSCAQGIYTALGRVKTNTMAKDRNPDAEKSYFSICRDGSTGSVVVKEVINDQVMVEKNVGAKEVGISIVKAGTTSSVGSGEVKCWFNRASGAVSKSDFDSIMVKGNNKEYEIKLYPSTGKMEMITIR